MSSETQKPSTKKTKWARSLIYATASAWFRPVALLIVCAAISLLLFRLDRPASRRLTLGGEQFQLEIVDSQAAREKGLSGRESLAPDRAMLFVFEAPARACMWMKDMRFSIDMVWLDADKKVIKIEQGAPPETYPQVFCTAGNASYVLELPSGTAAKKHIRLGHSLDF
jgi:uncharacterized membrane protein (UPF0127 family)